jgi:hypothetical protein
MTVPRLLHLDNDRLHQSPAPELLSLRRGEAWQCAHVALAPEASLPLPGVVRSSALDIEVRRRRAGGGGGACVACAARARPCGGGRARWRLLAARASHVRHVTRDARDTRARLRRLAPGHTHAHTLPQPCARPPPPPVTANTLLSAQHRAALRHRHRHRHRHRRPPPRRSHSRRAARALWACCCARGTPAARAAPPCCSTGTPRCWRLCLRRSTQPRWASASRRRSRGASAAPSRTGRAHRSRCGCCWTAGARARVCVWLGCAGW